MQLYWSLKAEPVKQMLATVRSPIDAGIFQIIMQNKQKFSA
jgi:hypothetical protein